MKKILLKIRGAWRLLFGFCPMCNSDAPLLYDCYVCKFGKRQKNLWWEIFLKHIELANL